MNAKTHGVITPVEPRLIQNSLKSSSMASELNRTVHVVTMSKGGVGKAQPLDARVLTPTGFRTMGDLRVGDTIVAPDGAVVPVTAVFPQGEKDIYCVSFRDGRTVECCADHLWKVWITGGVLPGGGAWKIMSLFEMQQIHMAGGRKAAALAVPLVEPFVLEQPPQELPIPAYTLGALLGDAHFHEDGNVIFSTPDPEHILVKILQENPVYEAVHAGSYDYRLRLILKNKPPGWMFKDGAFSPLTVALKTLGLACARSHTKFVPDAYKRGSVAQRLATLQGLMDTDGSVEGSANTCASITSTSERLAHDVQELAWSLGAIASIKSRQTFFTYKGERKAGRPSYRVNIVHPDIGQFFTLPRQLVKCRVKNMRHRLNITDIDFIGRKSAQCIAVDHPDHLYVTNGYVVTHNTLVAWNLVQYLRDHGKTVTAIDLDSLTHSLVEWKGLFARPVDLLTGPDALLNGEALDRLAEDMIVSGAGENWVLDNGSSGFVGLTRYLVDNEFPAILRAHDGDMVIHAVMIGGPDSVHCLTGLHALLTDFKPPVKFVLWLNEFAGPFVMDGKLFEEMNIYRDMLAEDRVIGVVRLAELKKAFLEDFTRMRSGLLTYGEATGSQKFLLMNRQRLTMIRRWIWDQLDALGFGA